MYDNDLDYWVHVVGPPETRLVFVFQRIELEFQKDCLYDFVEVKFSMKIVVRDSVDYFFFQSILKFTFSGVAL